LFFLIAKINIGLIVNDKRADGYHNIETIFYPVPLNDVLEIIPSREPKPSTTASFTHSGILIDGEEKDNLCVKSLPNT
jgi:4-diphosphocytidyl-2-C-methyl-D-erythritol kinase